MTESIDAGREMTRMLIGEIREELLRQDLSLNAFARMTGISRKRLGRIFKAAHPSETELRRIATVVRREWQPAQEAETDGT